MQWRAGFELEGVVILYCTAHASSNNRFFCNGRVFFLFPSGQLYIGNHRTKPSTVRNIRKRGKGGDDKASTYLPAELGNGLLLFSGEKKPPIFINWDLLLVFDGRVNITRSGMKLQKSPDGKGSDFVSLHTTYLPMYLG